MSMRLIKKSDEPVFDAAIFIISFILLIIVLYPLIFVVSASFSNPMLVIDGKVWLFPKEFTLECYKMVFKDENIMVGYKNSLIYTVIGTSINLIMTILAAYPLSRKDMPGRTFIMFFISFTMFFSGGLIPTYLLVKSLGMVNNIYAMVIPGAISTMNLIIMRSYFQNNIPVELQEASFIDGCNNFKLLWSIVLPLSKPIIAIMILYYGVGHWNAFFNALIYLRNKNLYPLQLVLREILMRTQIQEMGTESFGMNEQLMLSEGIKYAVIVVASLPALIAYPFIQKYFVKGVMIGAIKG